MKPPVLKSSASFAAIAVSIGAAFCAGCATPQLGRDRPAAAQKAAVAAAPVPAPEAAALSYPQTRPLDQKRPIKIKSDHLRYNDKLKETEFTGHVVATQDSSTLFADSMHSSTQGESASARGHLRLLDPMRKVELFADEGDYSGALSEANLRGGVVMHSVDPYAVAVTVTGQSGWYQSVSRKARLDGNVELMRGALTATAQSAVMDGAADMIELSGRVLATLGPNNVTADNAVLDGAKKSVCFIGGVKASLIPSQIRERASHPERP